MSCYDCSSKSSMADCEANEKEETAQNLSCLIRLQELLMEKDVWAIPFVKN